eukprot:TRINITY_DN7827_c0_g1_i12.p2 TRINITY_DN7827_c0_g1~~TRINITY_DN7827_c0_g1_i12.p2  ORF type:complete len:316 (+),score=52.80 TRINITY_DN7827_c0_g1_i12:103-1050(+)
MMRLQKMLKVIGPGRSFSNLATLPRLPKDSLRVELVSEFNNLPCSIAPTFPTEADWIACLDRLAQNGASTWPMIVALHKRILTNTERAAFAIFVSEVQQKVEEAQKAQHKARKAQEEAQRKAQEEAQKAQEEAQHKAQEARKAQEAQETLFENSAESITEIQRNTAYQWLQLSNNQLQKLVNTTQKLPSLPHIPKDGSQEISILLTQQRIELLKELEVWCANTTRSPAAGMVISGPNGVSKSTVCYLFACWALLRKKFVIYFPTMRDMADNPDMVNELIQQRFFGYNAHLLEPDSKLLDQQLHGYHFLVELALYI